MVATPAIDHMRVALLQDVGELRASLPPASPVSPMRGRKFAIETPTSAFAATTLLLGLRATSGRRSSSCAGTPTGICGGVVLLERAACRAGSGPGARPSSTMSRFSDLDDPPLELGDRRGRVSRAPPRARSMPSLEPTPPSNWRSNRSSIFGKASTVCARDLELAVELEQLEVGRGDVARQRQHARRGGTPRSRTGSARAASFERRMRPQMSISQARASAPQERVVAWRAGRGRAEHGVRAARRVELAVDLRKELASARRPRARAPARRARRRCAGRSCCASASSISCAQRLVLEDLPPRQVGERRRLGGCVCSR